MRKSGIREIRRITAIMLAVVLCILCCACTKEKNKNEEHEQLAYYKIFKQESYEYTISYPAVIDNTFYGCYIKGQGNDNVSYGMFQYDFGTKKSGELELPDEVQQIKYMYVDGENNLVIHARISETETSDSQNKMATYVYNTDFELLSKNETEEENIKNSSGEVVDICGDRIVKVVETSDTEHDIIMEDMSGNELDKAELKEVYLNGLIKADSDTLVALTGDNSGYKLNKLSISSGQKFTLEVIAELKNTGNVSIYPQNQNEILLSLDGYLNICDINTGKLKKVLKYTDSSIDSRKIRYVCEMDEDSYAVLLYDFENDNSQIDLISSKDVTQEKQEIHLATTMIQSGMESKVMEFNRTHDEYRIVIDEYVTGNNMMTQEDIDHAMQQFNLDILTGNGADIIDLSYYIDIKQYAGKGVFEDLSPYLERDSEISEADFIENVLEICKVDGTLYTLSPSFTIKGLLGATSRVGEKVSWTPSEFVDYASHLPDGVQILEWITSENLLRKILQCDFDEFIDWKNKKCNFNSEEFIAILELCNRYLTNDEHYELIKSGDANLPTGISGIREHKLELYEFDFGDIENYLKLNQIFGEETTIKGYPVSEGTGVVVSMSGNSYAINAKSRHKEAAWEFIKQYYTYDAQMSTHDFPVIKAAFEDRLMEERMKELQEAPDGTKYYARIDDTVTIYCPPPTDEDIKRMREIISLADTTAENSGIEIFSIIEEEAESYFVGQKSAKEVAEIIQSRVSIYVNEQG